MIGGGSRENGEKWEALFFEKSEPELDCSSGVSILGDMTSTENDPKTGSIGDNTAF